MGGHQYEIVTFERRLVAEYTGLSFAEIGRLDYGLFLLYRRDAFINRLNSTEAGRAYLDEAWRLSQTKPDRKRLRDKFGKGAADGS